MRAKFLNVLAVIALIAALTGTAFAQQGGPVNVRATDTSTGVSTEVGDNTSHALRVNVVAGSGGGTSITDNTAFTQGTTAVTPAGALYATSWTSPTAGRASVLRMDVNGGIYTNLDKVGTNSILTGNGGTGTGSIRVTIASDNAAFSVNAVQSGTWSVRAQDGAGNALTSNSTTYTAKFGLDGNLLGTLGTAFSTAGKVDVKGADGDVFVRQATGSNLHTVLDSGTLTTLSTLTTITNAVITKPIDACGTTNEDFQALIADTTLDVVTAATTCVDSIIVSNKGSASTTILVQDTSGTPLVLVPTTTIAPGGSLVLNALAGVKMTSGIKVQANNANNLTYWIKGRQ